MRIVGWVLVSVGVSCVTTGDGNLMKADVKKLHDAVKALETGTHDQKVKFERLVAEANRHIERVQALIKESTDFLAKNNAAFGADMEGVKQTVAKLSGKIEEVQHGVVEWQTGFQKTFGEFKGRVDKQLGNISEGLPGQLPDTPEGLLELAAKHYKSHEYGVARKLWESFLQKYGTHEKAALTQWWIAESLFEEGRFERALELFNEVRKKWPGSNVVPATLWKIALSAHQLGDKELAVAAASELIRAFPESEMAKQAKRRLKEFKKGQKKAG